MDNSFEERRQHLRIYRNFILSYREKDSAVTNYNVSQVNNVSKGGINFSTTHPLKEGTVIEIVLKTPFITEPIHVEGFVLQCKEKIAGMIYEIRLQFYPLGDQILAILDKIENYSKEKKGKSSGEQAL